MKISDLGYTEKQFLNIRHAYHDTLNLALTLLEDRFSVEDIDNLTALDDLLLALHNRLERD